MRKKRCVIYPKDVQLMTGKSERYGQDVLNKVKIFFNKQPHQFVTIHEFCKFSGIPLELVEEYL